MEGSLIGSFNVKRVLKLVPVLNTTTTTLPTTPSGCTCHYFAAAKSRWSNIEMETLHRAVICRKQPEGNIFLRRRCNVTAQHCQLQIGIAGRSARSQSEILTSKEYTSVLRPSCVDVVCPSFSLSCKFKVTLS